MKLACQAGVLRKPSLAEEFQALERIGFEGVELGGAGLSERVGEVKSAIASTNLKVSSVCIGYRGTLLSQDPAERDTAVGDIKGLLDVAAEIGAGGLIVVPIFGQPRVPNLKPYASIEEIEKGLLVKLLRDQIAPHAEKAGSLVLLEPLNRYETHFMNRLEQAAEISKIVGSPAVKIMADFFHMNIEEADIASSIREAGEFVAHVHLADSNRVCPGKGHTDFRAGFATLKQVGFDGYMALECRVPEPREEELRETVRFLRESIAAA